MEQSKKNQKDKFLPFREIVLWNIILDLIAYSSKGLSTFMSKVANLPYTSYYMTRQYYPVAYFKIWRNIYGIKEGLRNFRNNEKNGMLYIMFAVINPFPTSQ